MSNIPPIIESLVSQLNDTSAPFWVRNNACITLDQIVEHCSKHIRDFQNQAAKCKAKELKSKK